MPVQASVRYRIHLFRPLFAVVPGDETAQSTTYVICMPSFVRVICAFEYASTNLSNDFWRTVSPRVSMH